MAKKKVKTTKPSGLTIKRSGGKFTCTWKIPSGGYGSGQVLQIDRWGEEIWEDVSVGKTTTSKAFTIQTASYYPNTTTKSGKTVLNPVLPKVAFRVKGTRSDTSKINYTASAWAKKTFDLDPPKAPTITTTVGTWPQSTFAWSVASKADDKYWFTQVKYQSVLVKNSTVTDGSKINWDKTVTGSTKYNNTSSNASGSLVVTEDSSLIGDGNSYTRWFRACAKGPGGYSAWKYAKHVYANPCAPTVTKVNITTLSSKYKAKVWYNTPKSAARPITNVEVQWAIATPDEGMACPAGASWTTAVTALAKDTTGAASFDIGTELTSNQCLYIRVNAVYSGSTTQGTEKMALAGTLSTPTITSVTPDTSSNKVTVVASNTASDVEDSFLVVRYYDAKEPNGFDIAVIPHGQTTATGVQCPQFSGTPGIGVYAAVGTYTSITRADGVSRYTVKAKMKSAVQKQGGSIPAAPTNVQVAQTDIPGTIRVTWNWSWSAADSAELSWSDHDDAWESTDEPSTYTITKLHAAAWNISGLETGQTWYVRVRLVATTSEGVTYGAYSDLKEIDLSSAPIAPVLTLSDSIIPQDGSVTASWAYSTTDGTPQAVAEIATVSGGVYTKLPYVIQTAQNITLNAEELGWTTGNTYAIAVNTTSGSGHESGWSDPVEVTVADPPSCEITYTSLETVATSTTDEQGTTVTENVTALTTMPLIITVEGAGDSDTTTVVIERAEAYHVDRPDETDMNGFEGETIAIHSQTGEGSIAIDNEDLLGRLDDGALYRIIATVSDGLGQSAEATQDFQVIWSHQASAPTANVTIEGDTLAAQLIATAPSGYASGDVCDIYRLSVDRPQLVIEGASFGTTYVDPYPAIGEFGGYRFVTRTANGDYIAADDTFAWVDVESDLEIGENIIDFDDGQLHLAWNVDISNAWKKEFKETQYLGGAVQGDWNRAVSRTSSVTVYAIPDTDQELIQAMRRLAVFPGVCHIRTKDGSSYTADVQVSESYTQSSGHNIAAYTLTITRVDPEELDGMTLAEWQAIHDEE